MSDLVCIMNVRLTSFQDIGVDEIEVHGDDWPARSLSTLFSIDLSFCSIQERSWKTKRTSLAQNTNLFTT